MEKIMQYIFKSLLVILTIGLVSWAPSEIDLSRRANKKLSKALNSVWDMENVELKPVAVSFYEHGNDEPEKKIFVAKERSERLGFLVISSAKGRFDYFDYAVIYDVDLRIIRVTVLEYRSDHGYEITNKGWLKQFVGKKGCDLSYGKNIDAISGATISAGSITTDIVKICHLLNGID